MKGGRIMKHESLFTKTSKDSRFLDLEYGIAIRITRCDKRFQAELFVEDTFLRRPTITVHGETYSNAFLIESLSAKTWIGAESEALGQFLRESMHKYKLQLRYLLTQHKACISAMLGKLPTR